MPRPPNTGFMIPLWLHKDNGHPVPSPTFQQIRDREVLPYYYNQSEICTISQEEIDDYNPPYYYLGTQRNLQDLHGYSLDGLADALRMGFDRDPECNAEWGDTGGEIRPIFFRSPSHQPSYQQPHNMLESIPRPINPLSLIPRPPGLLDVRFLPLIAARDPANQAIVRQHLDALPAHLTQGWSDFNLFPLHLLLFAEQSVANTLLYNAQELAHYAHPVTHAQAEEGMRSILQALQLVVHPRTPTNAYMLIVRKYESTVWLRFMEPNGPDYYARTRDKVQQRALAVRPHNLETVRRHLQTITAEDPPLMQGWSDFNLPVLSILAFSGYPYDAHPFARIARPPPSAQLATPSVVHTMRSILHALLTHITGARFAVDSSSEESDNKVCLIKINHKPVDISVRLVHAQDYVWLTYDSQDAPDDDIPAPYPESHDLNYARQEASASGPYYTESIIFHLNAIADENPALTQGWSHFNLYWFALIAFSGIQYKYEAGTNLARFPPSATPEQAIDGMYQIIHALLRHTTGGHCVKEEPDNTRIRIVEIEGRSVDVVLPLIIVQSEVCIMPWPRPQLH